MRHVVPETGLSGFRGTIELMAGYEHGWDAAGMESTSDVGDLTGVQRAYDTVAADYAKHLPDTRAEAPLDLAMIDEFAGIVTNAEGRVLDAGCGTGRMSRYLADRGCDVQGLDLSPGMIKIARQQHPDLTFTVGTLTDLPYPDHHFAGVLLWYSIIHTQPISQARIFTEIARVLRPGGHVLIGSQSGKGVRDVAAAYRAFGHEVELFRYLNSADEIVARIESAGLHEMARLVRRSSGSERDDQAIVLAKSPE